MTKKIFLMISNFGEFFVLLGKILYKLPLILSRLNLVFFQIRFLGNYSLAIILISGLFVGLVLGLQGYYTLRRYGSEEALGLLVALSLVRELGPVVSALLFSGRAGTSLTAEIGLMKAGEQLAALESMGVSPIERILCPRFIAGITVVPMLASLFSAIGVIGGWIVAVLMIGVDSGAFWSQMSEGVDFWGDVVNGFFKSFVFGVLVTHISLYMGYKAKPTPEGVSSATTQTVIVSAFSILGMDFILTALMFN